MEAKKKNDLLPKTKKKMIWAQRELSLIPTLSRGLEKDYSRYFGFSRVKQQNNV